MLGQMLDMAKQDESRQVDLPPGLGFCRCDQLLKLFDDDCAQGVQHMLDDDLIQLRVHNGRNGDFSVVRAGCILDPGNTKCVVSAHFPWGLDDSRDGPEVESVGDQGVLPQKKSAYETKELRESKDTYRIRLCIPHRCADSHPRQLIVLLEGVEI